MSYKMCLPSLATTDCNSDVYEDVNATDTLTQNNKEMADASDACNEGESCNSTDIPNVQMISLGADNKSLELRTSQLELLMLQESDTSSSNVCLGDWQTHVANDLFEPEQVEAYISSLRQVVNVEDRHPSMHCFTPVDSDLSSTYDTTFTDMMVGNVSPNLLIPESHSFEQNVSVSHQQQDAADGNMHATRCPGLLCDYKNTNNFQHFQTGADIFHVKDFETITGRVFDVISDDNNQNNLHEKENKPNFTAYRNPMPSVAPAGMKPSGIGLHLNSLIHSMRSQQPDVPPQMNKSTSVLRSVRTMSIPPDNYFPFRSSTGHISTGRCKQGIVVSLVKKPRIENCNINSNNITSSLKSAPPTGTISLGIRKLDDNVSSTVMASVIAGQKRPIVSGFYQSNFENTEVSTQSICQTKKRKPSSTSEKPVDSCKRCNCKRSKCLKLYCECFAAGVYCGDSCTCTECLNKPETEDKVMEARQLIESRNPLAFAPKIVRSADTPPITQTEDISDANASGRHKRGCNCKRSQCLKKYCECYQAGVGCSDSCRCDSCKNTYGKKERSAQFDSLPKVTLVKDVGVVNNKGGQLSLSSKLHPSHLASSTGTLHMFTTTIDAAMQMQVVDCTTPSIIAKNCNPAQDTMASIGIQSSIESPNSRNNAKQSHTPSKCQETPVTPVFSPSMLDIARDDASFFKESETPLNQLLESAVTPELLKDERLSYSSFACLLNSSSPGHKRVSPPHQHASRLFHKGVQAQRLRSGRKLILQSVPAAPPSPIPIDL